MFSAFIVLKENFKLEIDGSSPYVVVDDDDDENASLQQEGFF